MRVVHVVTQLGTYGGERLVAALAVAQRSAGIDVSVVTIYDSPNIDVGGVPVYCAGRRGHGARGGGILFFFRLTSLIRRLRPDVVHTHLAHAKHWGRLAALAAGARCIVHTEHGNDFSASFPRRALTRLLHRRTPGIVALTHAHAQRIARYEHVPADRIAVVPNGVALDVGDAVTREEARRALGVPDGARAVLFLGRLDRVKQPLHALAACALLPVELNAHVYFARGRRRDCSAGASSRLSYRYPASSARCRRRAQHVAERSDAALAGRGAMRRRARRFDAVAGGTRASCRRGGKRRFPAPVDRDGARSGTPAHASRDRRASRPPSALLDRAYRRYVRSALREPRRLLRYCARMRPAFPSIVDGTALDHTGVPPAAHVSLALGTRTRE